MVPSGPRLPSDFMRIRLIPLDGSPPIDVSKDMLVIGRADDADIRIDHKSISKRHSVLVKTGEMLLVRDLGSTNGTQVNGQRVRRANLVPEDVIAFANFRFRMKVGESQSEIVPPDGKGSLPKDAIEEPPDTPPPPGSPAPASDEPRIKRNALPDVYEK